MEYTMNFSKNQVKDKNHKILDKLVTKIFHRILSFKKKFQLRDKWVKT